MKRSETFATLLGSVALVAMTGCTPGTVDCPAIGWINTLTVEVTGQVPLVRSIQLCTKEGCAPGVDLDPSSPLNLIQLIGQEGQRWSFATDMLPLEELTVRTLDVDGAVSSETVVTPEWKRIGGSEACGGPSTAVVSVTS